MCGQLHASASLPPENNPCTHWRADWTEPRGRLDTLENIKLFSPPRIRTANRPSHYTTYDIQASLCTQKSRARQKSPSWQCHEGRLTNTTPFDSVTVKPRYRNKEQNPSLLNVRTNLALFLHTANLAKYRPGAWRKSPSFKQNVNITTVLQQSSTGNQYKGRPDPGLLSSLASG
jgi:hypothetical protein